MSNKKGRYLLLGAFLGFIAGMFFAPKKGHELRRDAKRKLEEVKENPKDVLQETLDVVKGKVNNLIEENILEDDIQISEEEIVISRTFDDEGEDN